MSDLKIYKEKEGEKQICINEKDKIIYYRTSKYENWVHLGIFKEYTKRGVKIHDPLLKIKFISFSKLEKIK